MLLFKRLYCLFFIIVLYYEYIFMYININWRSFILNYYIIELYGINIICNDYLCIYNYSFCNFKGYFIYIICYNIKIINIRFYLFVYNMIKVFFFDVLVNIKYF